MTTEPGPNRAAPPPAGEGAGGQEVLDLTVLERDSTVAWVGEHLELVRRSASGERVPYWILGIGFVLGLAAHVGGFMLKYSGSTEPVLLVADLIYALGWALWTGVIVVLFVEIWPKAKRRQYKQALDAYEAAVGPQARAGNGKPLDPSSAEDA